jgi:hypothetical protein
MGIYVTGAVGPLRNDVRRVVAVEDGGEEGE